MTRQTDSNFGNVVLAARMKLRELLGPSALLRSQKQKLCNEVLVRLTQRLQQRGREILAKRTQILKVNHDLRIFCQGQNAQADASQDRRGVGLRPAPAEPRRFRKPTGRSASIRGAQGTTMRSARAMA